jgi:cytochrome c oxidase assembly protein subunit 15
MRHAALLRTFALAACALCLLVVVLGAFVRLSDAGLGCPDWPGCYGHFTPAGAAAELDSGGHTAAALAAAARPLELGKAWREMVHRYAAGTVGLLIVCLTAMAVVWQRERIVPVALVVALLAIVVLQGALGMLTVTWQLTPLIVTLHLLFGLTTLSVLWWLVLALRRDRSGAWEVHGTPRGSGADVRDARAARGLALIGLLVLAAQITLGGWTSSNYAALACPDLPTCQGHWWPQADFRAGFVLWRGAGINYDGGVLANPARVAIQLSHRIGAVVTSAVLLAAALATLRLRRARPARAVAVLVLLMLATQLAIGTAMVLRGFPLWLATAHNAGAALLLLATLSLNRSLRLA